VEPDRIPELLRPFVGSAGPSLDDAQIKAVSIYIDLLLRWNSRINLTSVRKPEEIVTRHFGESFFAARHLFSNKARTDAVVDLVDLGSGAGFPGLPIKIWAPQLRVTLIESNQRKVVFLREVIRALALADAAVFAGRAEAFPGKAGTVILRAVEQFEIILPVAAALTAPAGRLALLIGEGQSDSAGRVMPGVEWSDPVSIPQSSNRILLVGTLR
jgi:16S rRNA (guanine527-N7)-methyltransferase